MSIPRAQAEAIVAACRFPPLGKRSVMGLGPALGYRAVPLAELNPKLNAETAVIVMLETAEGIENCEAIAAVDGDRCAADRLGRPDDRSRHPGTGRPSAAARRLRAGRRRVPGAQKVLGVGGIRHNTVLQGELIRLGARFVIAGTDTNYVLAGARQDTEALRAIKIG